MNGVEMDVFSTCRRCGVPISREIDPVTPAMDAWVDVTGGDACDDGVHEALTLPQNGAPLVFIEDHQINPARRVRAGRECTFVYEAPDESGDWYVSVPGEHGSMPRVVKVHPNKVKEVGA